MNTQQSEPILVTGAAGQLGAVGRTVVDLLLDRGLPVRALVRREDERAAALRTAGAEVVIADRGYDKGALVEEIESRGAVAVIPTQKNRAVQRGRSAPVSRAQPVRAVLE